MTTYKKRTGTSGIRGQLYETKLISLIYFRAKHDETIEEFQLATNMDEIGIFDDICFKVKIKGTERPVAVFIQAKHRENDKAVTLNQNDLVKYFDSYLKIKRASELSDKEFLFGGKFDATDCIFVMYSTAKDDPNNITYKGSFADFLNDLVGTGDPGSQPLYKHEDVEILCKTALKEQLASLAGQMAKFLCDKTDSLMSMNNDLVLRFHVILARKVLNVSEIQPEGYRIASFRQDFFDTKEELLTLFRETLVTELLRERKIEEKEMSIENFCKSRDIYLKNDEYHEMCEDYDAAENNVSKYVLDKWVIGGIKKAMNNANIIQLTELNEKLTSRTFKVPTAFGNKDLTLSGSSEKMEKRLNFLTSRFIALLDKSKPNNIVTIDESMEPGFLRLNGGIAGAVGNLLVTDDNPKLIKFTDNYESLGDLAKRLFTKLKDKVQNLNQYKFDVKVSTIPKLSFAYSEYEENLANDFLNKLLFYSNQADENEVEKILKSEIEDHHCKDIKNARVRSKAIFLTYHDEIQKWWMLPTDGLYLTKESDIYENAMHNIVDQPLTTVLNMMYMIKNKIAEYTFNENAVNSLMLHNQPLGTVIITECCALTVAKVIQYLKNLAPIVLDFENILNLPKNDYKSLLITLALANINNEKILIVICSDVQNTRSCSKILEEIAKTINDNNIILIIHKMSVETVKKYFSLAHAVIDDRNHLTDMNEESQNSILDNARVIFQGEEVSLDFLVDDYDEAMVLVEGEVLNKMIHNEKYTIGKAVGNPNYDKLKHLYVERGLIGKEFTPIENADKVIRNKLNTTSLYTKTKVKSFNTNTLNVDLSDVVLVLGKPGMGKSTLLTHMSIKTKRQFPELWIVRINLLEHSKEFSNWQKDKIEINTLESLHFICRVALSEQHDKDNKLTITLEESNGDVYLKDCSGDEKAVFEIKMFLHFYNSRELIFLFDGFDEICPHYAHEVLTLLRTVRNYPREHLMWITSRSYDKITSILELQFGIVYEIIPLTSFQQDYYLNIFWTTKIKLTEINDVQFENIYEFIKFISQCDIIKLLLKKNELPIQSKKKMPFLIVYFSFIYYLKMELKFGPPHVMDALSSVCAQRDYDFTYMGEFPATPLHLYLIADYLRSEITGVSKTAKQWDLDTDIFNIYERFLEMKLKKIRFEEKNQINMYNPDNILTYNRERADFMAIHKKLAAYAVFYHHNDKLFDKNEMHEFGALINMLKEGEEKTGIICNVVNNIPMFIHSTFAEYFAVEHICDLLKSSAYNDKAESVWNFILNVMFFNCNTNVLYTFDTKIKMDENLAIVIEKNKKIIFQLLLGQTEGADNKHGDIKSSFCEAIRNNLDNLASLFLSTFEENLDEDNILDFIKIVSKSNLLIIAIKMEKEDLVTIIVNHVKKIDQFKLKMLFENIEDFERNENGFNTDELIHELHRHVWTRMGVFPDWENLSDLCGQIYFI